MNHKWGIPLKWVSFCYSLMQKERPFFNNVLKVVSSPTEQSNASKRFSSQSAGKQFCRNAFHSEAQLEDICGQRKATRNWKNFLERLAKMLESWWDCILLGLCSDLLFPTFKYNALRCTYSRHYSHGSKHASQGSGPANSCPYKFVNI